MKRNPTICRLVEKIAKSRKLRSIAIGVVLDKKSGVSFSRIGNRTRIRKLAMSFYRKLVDKK